MSDKRIFIALDISDAARLVCASHIDELRRTFPKVRIGWERAEKLHITLQFLGPVDERVLEKLQERLAHAVSERARYKVRLSNAGVFPSRSRARILWIGIDDAARAVDVLYDDVRMISGSLGFREDVKAFKPHVTVGRIRETAAASELVTQHLGMKIEPVSFEVPDVVIYESQLQPTGSIYSVVSRLQLR